MGFIEFAAIMVIFAILLYFYITWLQVKINALESNNIDTHELIGILERQIIVLEKRISILEKGE